MANDENLKAHEFKPGQSGNPKGRTPGTKNLATILRHMLEEKVPVIVEEGKPAQKKTFKEVLVRKLISMANQGDVRAIREIFDRVDGKSRQSLDITTDGEPLTEQNHRVEFVDFSAPPKVKPKPKPKA